MRSTTWRLVSFDGGYGRIEDDRVVPMGRDIRVFLGGGSWDDGHAVAVDDVDLLAPVPEPSKIVCVGLNYRDHVAEAGKSVPEEPVLFGKWANSVTSSGAEVELPPMAEKVDYEGELGIIIGRPARRVSPDQAWEHIAGYTVLNDLSARDLQWRLNQWTRGKAIDDFLPMGPWLVTRDEIDDPHALRLTTELNGEVVQDSSTAELIFGVHELVSTISQTIALDPGDCIATGTPPGVGFSYDPPKFLRPGDEVAVEIAGIGRLVNTMVAPPRHG